MAGADRSLLAHQVVIPEFEVSDATDGAVTIRTAARALTGMQKEALVVTAGQDHAWRLLCDEGPYLNGTDLAPPPLAYFSAGMASLFADAIESHELKTGNQIGSLEIVQDNRYAMEGSALRGTMTGSALPVEIEIPGKTDSGNLPDTDDLAAVMASSSIEALMQQRLVDTFSLTHNQKKCAPGALVESKSDIPTDPLALLDTLRCSVSKTACCDVVSKLKSTESVFEADHGAGAAMKAEQKRELHIRSILKVRSDGLRNIRVQIFKPVGSVFGFITEAHPGSGIAPNGYELVSAGIAFCFMTQIGRFAGIAKKTLDRYSVVQDTQFGVENAACKPVDSHVSIVSPESTQDIQHMVTMAEQTCFLHAACRESNPTRIVTDGG